MKRRIKLYLLLAVILLAINGSMANPGRKFTGVTCGMKYVGKEKVHIGVAYTGHTFNLMFNTPGRIQSAELGKTLKFNSQRSYTAIVRLLGKRQVGLRASLGASHIEYLISGATSNQNFNHIAERRDIDLAIGIEKHIAFSKIVRMYFGPNIPITLKGSSSTNSIDISEMPTNILAIGGGITAGIIFKISKFLTLGLDCESLYRSQTFTISNVEDQVEKLKFGNLGLKGNIYLGIAF